MPAIVGREVEIHQVPTQLRLRAVPQIVVLLAAG